MTYDFTTAPYPWQLTEWQQLLQRYRNEHLPHALLLTGTAGLGQFEFALQFAKLVLCEQGKQQDLPCNQCRSCLLMQAKSQPDFYCIQPEEVGKSIKIDVVREMLTEVVQTSLYAHYKIVLIEPAEALNIAASNALLKNLEEPTGNTLFILVSNQPQRLLATIRSRCQLITIKPPTLQEAGDWLKPLLKAGQNSQLLLSLALQAPLRALELAYQERLQERELLIADLQQISDNQALPVQIAAKWTKIDINELLNAFINIVVDCIRLNAGLPQVALLNIDKTDFIAKTAAKISLLKLFNYLDELYQWRKQLNNVSQLNQQLLLETFFYKWYEYGRN